MIKKVLLATLCTASLYLVACDKQTSQTSANIQTEKAKVVVGLDDNFPPMGFRDSNGDIVGFDIDLAKEATKRAGLEVEFKAIDWGAKEAELKSKRVDMLWNGLTITAERQKQVLFSEPYMANHQMIVVIPDSLIKNKADLVGSIVGVQDASSAVDAVNADPIHTQIKELKRYPDNVTALLELKNKRVEAVVVDEVVGRYYVAKHPQDYRVLSDNFGTESYGIGFRKDDQALRNRIQDALDTMKADGKSQQISEKWFGASVIE